MFFGFVDDLFQDLGVDHSRKRFIEIFQLKRMDSRLYNCFADSPHLLQIELDVVKAGLDLHRKRFDALLHLQVIDLFLAKLPDSRLDSGGDDFVELLERFGHAEGHHGAEGEFEDVLLLEEVDAAEDEAEAEGEFLLAGGVEGGQEHFAEQHFLDVIHEDVEVVQLLDDVGVAVQQLFYLVYPGVQVEWLRQPLELDVFGAKVLVELDVEEFEEIGPFVSQSAVDFDEGGVGLGEERVDE